MAAPSTATSAATSADADATPSGSTARAATPRCYADAGATDAELVAIQHVADEKCGDTSRKRALRPPTTSRERDVRAMRVRRPQS